MRQNYFFSKNSNALLEPYEGKLSCTVLRGESSSNGADLLDSKIMEEAKVKERMAKRKITDALSAGILEKNNADYYHLKQKEVESNGLPFLLNKIGGVLLVYSLVYFR